MPDKKFLKRVVPAQVKEYLGDIQTRLASLERTEAQVHELMIRIEALEITVDTMLSSPVYSSGDDVGFNSQKGRKEILRQLLHAVEFDAIVETGTWLGDTTGYMAQTARVPVVSAEINKRFHLMAKSRLIAIDNVECLMLDSRALLRKLSQRAGFVNHAVLFYLDAHWYDDLPLAEEITIIADNWRNFVIMIDDFEVPGDSGYLYDNYGNGKALTLDYVRDFLSDHKLDAFFPTLPSQNETGARRGCIVLAPQGETADRVARVESLRKL